MRRSSAQRGMAFVACAAMASAAACGPRDDPGTADTRAGRLPTFALMLAIAGCAAGGTTLPKPDHVGQQVFEAVAEVAGSPKSARVAPAGRGPRERLRTPRALVSRRVNRRGADRPTLPPIPRIG